MAAPTLGDVFRFVDVLRTTVTATSKKIVAQIGSIGSESGGEPAPNDSGDGEVTAVTDNDDVEWWQHVGFASRPPKADPGNAAAQAFLIRQGGIDAAIASQDLRGLAIYGNLADGETCVYAGGADGKAQARVLLKADGSATLYTKKGNTDGGAGMMIQLDAANGAIRLVNDQGYGIIIDSSGVTLTAKNAGLTLGSDGNIKLIGTKQTQIDGAGVCLGSVVVPGVNSAITGPTGIAGKASLKVLIE